MFLTLTPNPCLERTLELPRFLPNSGHRIASEHVRVSAGGKGINAARVAQSCGLESTVVLPCGVLQAPWMHELLAVDRFAVRMAISPTSTRTCTNVITTQGVTELVEAGDPWSRNIGEELLEQFDLSLDRATMAALCGSYPGSDAVETEEHALKICALARAKNVPLIYDGKGAAYAACLHSDHPPWMIKPNQAEAAALLRQNLNSPGREMEAVREFLGWGVEVVVLSCGNRGAWLGHQGRVDWITAPRITEVCAVGSGDSFVGAFAAKFWANGGDLVEAAAFGAAAGAVNATRSSSATMQPDEIDQLLPQVKVVRGC